MVLASDHASKLVLKSQYANVGLCHGDVAVSGGVHTMIVALKATINTVKVKQSRSNQLIDESSCL